MKARFLVLMLGLFVFSTLAADLTGVWTGQITAGANKHDITLKIKADGNKITGTITGAPPNGAEQSIEGQVDGDHISFVTHFQGPDGSDHNVSFTGQVSGNQIQGSVLRDNTASDKAPTFTITRK